MTITRRYKTVHNAWIRQFHDPGADGPTLVCFPHAGGSASAHLPLSAELSAAAEVLIAQYPGRQDRLAEPAVDDLRRMADHAAHALRPWRNRPLALFGHSMGALLAYEVALRLERHRGRPLAGLIVSGRAAPSVPFGRRVHTMDDEQFTGHLAGLGGTPPELLADKDLLAMALPSLRADYKAVETYQDHAGHKVGCPISSYCGKQDAGVPRDGFGKWAEYTTGRHSARLFDGGHFYLQTREREVGRAILQDLTAFTARDTAEGEPRPTASPAASAPALAPLLQLPLPQP
ncbi:thioesterase II family protein [Streptomyces sp. NPDC051217]|uniref:thioesterase II family protein n=1 Tax=Streptomyces sp. NPDC051217 TaxID=3365644 RepID=UPI00378CC2A5